MNTDEEREKENAPEPAEELVELADVQGEFEANVLKGVLESEGIDAAVKAGMVQDIFPFTVDGLGLAKVFVKSKDLERAKTVLDEYRDEHPAEDGCRGCDERDDEDAREGTDELRDDDRGMGRDGRRSRD